MKEIKNVKRHILWERVVVLIVTLLLTFTFVSHVIRNGFYSMQVIEVMQDLLIIIMSYLITKELRTRN